MAKTAVERGAKLIVITESQSPLARKADPALNVNHVEDIATQVPMNSCVLHLLMVDILVVGVTLHRGTSVTALGSDATMGLDEGHAARGRASAQRGRWHT